MSVAPEAEDTAVRRPVKRKAVVTAQSRAGGPPLASASAHNGGATTSRHRLDRRPVLTLTQDEDEGDNQDAIMSMCDPVDPEELQVKTGGSAKDKAAPVERPMGGVRNADHDRGMQLYNAGLNVFLTGLPGKTHFLRHLCQYTRQQLQKRCIVVSNNHMSASQFFGAVSLYYLLHGHSVGSTASEHDAAIVKDNLEEADILLIDDVHLISAGELDECDRLARLHRGSDKPFGGLQVVMAGDFLQSRPPPVLTSMAATAPLGGSSGSSTSSGSSSSSGSSTSSGSSSSSGSSTSSGSTSSSSSSGSSSYRSAGSSSSEYAFTAAVWKRLFTPPLGETLVMSVCDFRHEPSTPVASVKTPTAPPASASTSASATVSTSAAASQPPTLVRLLQELRTQPSVSPAFLQCIDQHRPRRGERPPPTVLHITIKRADAAAYNDVEFKKLRDKARIFHSTSYVNCRDQPGKARLDTLARELDCHSPCASPLALKVGARVALVCDINAQLRAGMRGTLVRFVGKPPAQPPMPVVRFDDLDEETMIRPFRRWLETVAGTAIHMQIPLVLAWALSVPDIHGLTLEEPVALQMGLTQHMRQTQDTVSYHDCITVLSKLRTFGKDAKVWMWPAASMLTDPQQKQTDLAWTSGAGSGSASNRSCSSTTSSSSESKGKSTRSGERL
jgi:hypothetical protein